MMGTWWKRCDRQTDRRTDGRTDRQTDRRTDWTSHIAAWSQLKKSEWRILWGADGLNTSDLREWRNVYLALAIIIVLWYFLWNWNADTLWTTVVWHQDTFQLSAKSYKKITLNNNVSVYPKRTFYKPKSIIDIPVTCKWTVSYVLFVFEGKIPDVLVVDINTLASGWILFAYRLYVEFYSRCS